MKVVSADKQPSSNRPKNPALLRVLQVAGGFIIGLVFTGVGTILWTSHAGLSDSLFSRLSIYLLLILFGPGMYVAIIVGGGHFHDDPNLVVAQMANLAIYTGLGYVFFRFLEWRKSKSK